MLSPIFRSYITRYILIWFLCRLGTPLANIPVKWSKFEPDNVKDREGCITMQITKVYDRVNEYMYSIQGTLADKNCADPFPYICYKKNAQGLDINACGTSDSCKLVFFNNEGL